MTIQLQIANYSMGGGGGDHILIIVSQIHSMLVGKLINCALLFLQLSKSRKQLSDETLRPQGRAYYVGIFFPFS